MSDEEGSLVPTERRRDFFVEPASLHTGQTGPGGGGIHGLVEAFRRRWWQVLVVAAPVVALAAVYTYTAPRLYESTSTFLLEAGEASPGGSLGLLDRIGRVNRLENEIALLQSRRVLGPTADRLDLHVTVVADDRDLRPADVLDGFEATPEAVAGTYELVSYGDSLRVVEPISGEVVARSGVGDTITLPGIRFVAPDDLAAPVEVVVDDFGRATDRLGRAIDVSRLGRDADLVGLTCTASDPQRAHRMCVEVSDSYLSLRGELQVSEAANARQFLTDATMRIEEQLNEAEDSLTSYSRRNGAVALDTRADTEVRNLSEILAQRGLKEAERAALRGFLARIESDESGSSRYRELASFPTFLENEAITELVASLIALDNRRSDLATLRSESNPELAQLSSRIADIERQLKQMATSYEQALTLQIESLTEAHASATRRVSGIPETQVELMRRQRQVEQLEAMYGELGGRLREAQLAEGVGMPNVRPIDPPQVPLEPSSPSWPLNMAMGGAMGLALGVLFAAYREMTDNRVRSSTQVERAAGRRVIGLIPSVREPTPLLSEETSRTMGILARTGRSIGLGGSDPARQWHPAVESFRALAADLRIALSGSNGSGSYKSIAVMSSTQGEGKTYSSCNLALTWSAMGSRTLLIDGDLRMGRVARFLRLPTGHVGLADILRADVHPSNAIQEVRVRGGNTLHVVGAGQTSDFSIETFHTGSRIRDVVDYYRDSYDLIIVDTPPLNVVGESTVIASAVDAVLLVVRSGYTRPEALERALTRLDRTNERLLGIVLNDAELPSYYRSYYDTVGAS